MDVDLDGFKSYLVKRGRASATITQYLQEVRHSHDRVRERSRAPKSRRVTRAAWRAYARFSKDLELAQELDEVKLPPPERRRVQLPLPRDVFDRLRGAIRGSRLEIAKQAVIGIMMSRGLRCGDVLRLRKKEIEQAFKPKLLVFEAKNGRILSYGVTEAWKGYLELLLEAFEGERSTQVWQLLSNTEKGALAVMEYAFRRLAEDVDIGELTLEDIRPHIARRTYAVIVYEAFGRDVVRLKDHMQWADISTAAGYVDHSRREELDAIAESVLK